jgi:uncharacterized protein (TIGR01244 family)
MTTARPRLGPTLVKCLLLAVSLTAITASAQEEQIAINHVIVDQRLHTSGQPAVPQLQTLADRGFDLVVNLAPPTVQGAVAEEREVLEGSGVDYVNIPVDFRNPTVEDFDRFSEVMRQAEDRRILVHCQVNARASTFTFLYRVVHQGVAPQEAFALVEKVWTPVATWAEFGRQVLDRHGIEFTFPSPPESAR